MACTLQTDSEQWLELFGADPNLKQCFREIFGVISLEITDDTLTELSLLINLLQGQLALILSQLNFQNGQDACAQVIIDALTALASPTPETDSMLADIQARQLAIQADLAELQSSASTLPGQIVQRELLKIELECQKANAEFFNNLTS